MYNMFSFTKYIIFFTVSILLENLHCKYLTKYFISTKEKIVGKNYERVKKSF